MMMHLKEWHQGMAELINYELILSNLNNKFSIYFFFVKKCSQITV